MLFVTALSAEDLLKAIDSASDQRSHGCAPNLARFDFNKGVLQFVTRCAGSKDVWEQTVVLTDWEAIKPALEEPEEPPVEEEEVETAPIMPEELEEPVEEAEPTAPLVVPPSTPPAPKPGVPQTTLQPGKPLKTMRPLIQQSHLVLAQEILTWEEVKSKYPEVLLSDIKVNCSCPAYQYWGSHYILDQLDSAVTPETRYPEIRDSQLEHTLCKHLIAVLRGFF